MKTLLLLFILLLSATVVHSQDCDQYHNRDTIYHIEHAWHFMEFSFYASDTLKNWYYNSGNWSGRDIFKEFRQFIFNGRWLCRDKVEFLLKNDIIVKVVIYNKEKMSVLFEIPLYREHLIQYLNQCGEKK